MAAGKMRGEGESFACERRAWRELCWGWGLGLLWEGLRQAGREGSRAALAPPPSQPAAGVEGRPPLVGDEKSGCAFCARKKGNGAEKKDRIGLRCTPIPPGKGNGCVQRRGRLGGVNA